MKEIPGHSSSEKSVEDLEPPHDVFHVSSKVVRVPNMSYILSEEATRPTILVQNEVWKEPKDQNGMVLYSQDAFTIKALSMTSYSLGVLAEFPAGYVGMIYNLPREVCAISRVCMVQTMPLVSFKEMEIVFFNPDTKDIEVRAHQPLGHLVVMKTMLPVLREFQGHRSLLQN